ncbi:MAG: hypothetical protein WD270_12145 [Acetobacterales bacterium]
MTGKGIGKGRSGYDLAALRALVAAFAANPDAGEGDLRQARLDLARRLAELDGEVPAVVREALNLVLHSGLAFAPEIPDEREVLDGLDLARPPHLLAAMALAPAHRLDGLPALADVPEGMRAWYGRYLLTMPEIFQECGEADACAAALERAAAGFHAATVGMPKAADAVGLARLFRERFLAVPLYFSRRNLRETMRLRGEILAFLRREQEEEPAPVPPRRPAARRRLRIGVAMPAWVARTETFFVLPHVAALDRERFEVRLYADRWQDTPMEAYCRNIADSFTVLPDMPVARRAAAIRWDEPDLLVFGSNIAAGAGEAAELAQHRMAPVQVALATCPATTGLATVDVFLSSELTEPEQAQAHYTERLHLMPGGFNCFDYGPEAPLAGARPPRATFGVSEDALLLVSGANHYKLVPELEAAWVRILAELPKAVLALYPFNPNWTDRYPVWLLARRLSRSLSAAGVDTGRVRLLPPFADRGGVDGLLAVADLYLDSFPFTGSGSLVDPLRLGLPALTCAGESQRGLQGPSMLRSLRLDDLVASDPEDYVRRVVALGRGAPTLRFLRTRLAEAMGTAPFLDTAAFGARVGAALEAIHAEAVAKGLASRLRLNV